jgi:hypothetical protein
MFLKNKYPYCGAEGTLHDLQPLLDPVSVLYHTLTETKL